MSAALRYTAVGDCEDLLQQHFSTGYPQGFVRCEGTLLPAAYSKVADTILNLEVRHDDVWVCSFPKTGTTWTQEMVWCIANDLDFEGAKVHHGVRFPFLDLEFLVDGVKHVLQPTNDDPNIEREIPRFVNSIQFTKETPSPRFIKTHLPFHLLPLQLQRGNTGAKIVYIVRNAKDTCISYYHHVKLFESYRGDFDDFAKLFINDSLIDAPFWEHVLGYWEKKDNPNLLFLKYEDMKKDLPSVILRTAKFLGKDLSEDQVAQLADHLSFESMKKNPAVNFEDHVKMVQDSGLGDGDRSAKFMRSGQVGQWRSRLSPEQIQSFDLWTEQKLKGSGLSY